MAGSSLGQARNGGLIPGDDDVDFGIHQDDAEKLWKIRDDFIKLGIGIVKSDIGFKIGIGDLVAEEENFGCPKGVRQLVGPCHPFSYINADIFLFRPDGREKGLEVMRYTCQRARDTWPNEVIPVNGWFQPKMGKFGDLDVQILPKKYLDWYLTNSYGPNWMTHDGNGELLLKLTCSSSSKKRYTDY